MPPEPHESTAIEQPVVTIFRSRLRSDAGEDYPAMAERMLSLAEAMPGFVDFKQFTAADGERVSIITFDSVASHNSWRDHVEHRAAQGAGRTRFYETYTIQICRLVDERHFTA
jgi:heme-degrading monooxygenase HmoA